MADTERPPRAHLSARSKARKRALDVLFAAELRGVDPLIILAERQAEADPPVNPFSSELVQGVAEHQRGIDRRIAESLSAEWTLERMPRVDRIAARIAVYELDHTEISVKVAISEAVALVHDLSTDDSPGFLNGLLGRAASTGSRNVVSSSEN